MGIFNRIKSAFRKKEPAATVAWERKEAKEHPAKPANVPRTAAPPAPNRSASAQAFTPPSPASIVEEKRNTSTVNGHQPARGSHDTNKAQGSRHKKAYGRAAQSNPNDFIDAVTDGGNRRLEKGKTKGPEMLKNRGKGDTDGAGFAVRHRSGSVTEMVMGEKGEVKTAFHRSITTGEHLQLREGKVKGKARKELNRAAHKLEKRHGPANEKAR